MLHDHDDLCHCRIIHRERVTAAKNTAIDAFEVEKLANFFKAMADPTRLKMLWALDHGEMCVCDLAAFLGVTESAVSHQLRLLRQLQLVSSRRQGPVLYYRLNDDHISQLVRLGLTHIRE